MDSLDSRGHVSALKMCGCEFLDTCLSSPCMQLSSQLEVMSWEHEASHVTFLISEEINMIILLFKIFKAGAMVDA